MQAISKIYLRCHSRLYKPASCYLYAYQSDIVHYKGLDARNPLPVVDTFRHSFIHSVCAFRY